MTIISILLTALVPLSYSLTICLEEPCNFQVTPNEEYACGCNITNCNLDISGTDGKDITLYTFASKTKAICREKDSCQGASILYGIEPVSETGISVIKTDCPGVVLKKEIEIECESQTSCKDMNITSIGGKVNVKALELDSFDEGILDCYGPGNNCLLQCSNDVESCSDAKCVQQCNCIGKKCPGFTEAPTKNPVIELPDPTDPPVVDPPVMPVYSTCLGKTDVNGKCSLSPSANENILVVRSDKVKILEISCLESQQCKEIRVYSAANTTELICGNNYQTCIDAAIFVGFIDNDELPLGTKRKDFPNDLYDTVLATCDGEDSCKQMNVTIRGKFAVNPVIMAMGTSSFEESKLLCDIRGASCKLMCDNKQEQSCLNSTCSGSCVSSNLYPDPEPLPPVIEVNPLPNNPNTGNVVGPNPPINNGAKRFGKRVTGTTEIVTGTKRAKITLDKTNGECKIDCSAKDQCMGITVNSGCNITEIICGEAACKNARINIGALTDQLPLGTTASDFSGDKLSAIIRCDDYQACNNARINIVGNVGAVEISGLMPNGLYKARLLSLTSDVTINCDNGDGCKDFLVTCANDNKCQCIGGSCTALDRRSNNNITVTPAPTLQTDSPTFAPTSSPSVKPTPAPTSSDLIVYTPNARGIFICKKNVDTCVLDCNNAVSQCDQGVILLSAANTTEILCNAADTCKEIKIFLGTAITNGVLNRNNIDGLTTADFVNPNAVEVNLNCSAPSACKKADIKAVVSVSSGFVLSTSNSYNALKDTKLDITVATGQTCTIECDTLGCFDAKFIDITSCTCSGTSCPVVGLRKSINYVPSHGVNMNVNGSSHYPTFLPTAIIVCIAIGLICLISFCIYYKYFTTEEKKLAEYHENNLMDNGSYDTFNKQSTALEMNQI